ncbi:MAG: hypothetical protein HYU67_00775 [Flavobacteriia bacterium]|nr:hypothetical protein [Flavobacteriia bacterium]
MTKYFYFGFIVLFFSCSYAKKEKKVKNLNYLKQWINPLFLNGDFEKEINFPYWFCDSILKKNKIFQITRRIFSENEKDSNGHYVLPKEKYIYTFDKNGSIKKIDFYTFYDSKEITAFTFVYSKKINKNKIFRPVQVLPLNAEYNKYKDLFKIQLNTDVTHHFTFYKASENRKNYKSFQDVEHKNKLYIIKKKKYFGALSIDSILHPKPNDWIILGSIKNPIKRFQSQNIVKEANVFSYKYSKSGMLLRRDLEKYPFVSKKYFVYNNSSQWVMTIDSLFYETTFISSELSKIEYDQYKRPYKIYHNKLKEVEIPKLYVESFSYRLHK